MDRIYGYNPRTGEYVYRIPGHRHGDGQVDSDDSPVWLLTDEQTAHDACGGDVPDIDPDECERMTLTTDTLHDTIVVRDSEGGVWWPSDEAIAEIQAADDPNAKAIEICDQQPMRGEWKQ